ncbi:50S ribosomal protein L1 [Candidatus Saccharibacteria bacterium]|nr:50S ribosomal protein L1 [Candidatus Saccharibacteria bacterium]
MSDSDNAVDTSVEATEVTSEAVEAVPAEEVVSETPAEERFAKSGKRSKKITEEVAAETERKAKVAEKKESDEAEAAKPAGAKPIARAKIERRGKNYQNAVKGLDLTQAYAPKVALETAIESSFVKFDASVELHVNLAVDPRQADQNIRATVSLPHGTGRKIVVAAFVSDDQVKEAIAAGADIAGESEITTALTKGTINFDVLVTNPAGMPKLSKFARSLGPKGLMPNPKSGTVANDVMKAIKDTKAGRSEYRVDKQSIVHLPIGKVSFGADKLLDNYNAFLESLKSQKPASLKGAFVKNITVSTTMGPGIKVENNVN